jgi:hypothetical protein
MVKVYTMASGLSDIFSVTDGNFDAWEKQHIITPEASSP